MSYEFYWYPKCSTCQAAKKQLNEEDLSYEACDMIQNPPSADQLEAWLNQGKFTIRNLFNTSGMKYRELGLKGKIDSFSIREAAELLATDGMLIKRPLIVEAGELLAVGYRKEKYGELRK